MRGNTSKGQSETVRRIIEGATQAFAQGGFAGASVDEIAKTAGVNKASIYYHVGDKESLYGLVLHEVIQDALSRINERLQPDQSPEEKLKSYILGIAETVQKHPPLPAVMMSAVSANGRGLPEMVVSDLVQIYGLLVAILHEGEGMGIFERVDGIVLYLMIMCSLSIHKNVEAAWTESQEFAGLFQKLDGSLFNLVGQSLEGGVAADVIKIVLKAVRK
ncbi:transcriptional regulator, TetR family [Desulfatibacillum alkenivorans DSM 16219]|jgi:AcrR family transcriptional regulator|uniref:Transcriptional regulator, TetR family n=1 Tax=Desulfatibacillum alkenivorans DSM 16219 TaxID=1121393 RepID=A0A1M6HCI6_9BACT|nr:TetR/AcrR family transcriptional regulator [Desulfatibacillum alkenivorans]SHJ19874.1 transcriptional regulator, TetR family [Desulfatibacillum alkenivorans DSM 16219]